LRLLKFKTSRYDFLLKSKINQSDKFKTLMKIKLLAIGKTDNKNLIQLIEEYQNRLKHYIKFELEIIPDIKKGKHLSEVQQKEKEGALLLSKLQNTDQLVLLDDKGKHFTSVEFSQYLQKKMNAGIKQLVLVIGGPYGFSDAVYKKSNGKISLSKMTFSHQMIRLFIVEQLYRGFTILKNEPYHHE
jgi:23S rRNA (pseudouridine1915-N3)-methyltransferase